MSRAGGILSVTVAAQQDFKLDFLKLALRDRQIPQWNASLCIRWQGKPGRRPSRTPNPVRQTTASQHEARPLERYWQHSSYKHLSGLTRSVCLSCLSCLGMSKLLAAFGRLPALFFLSMRKDWGGSVGEYMQSEVEYMFKRELLSISVLMLFILQPSVISSITAIYNSYFLEVEKPIGGNFIVNVMFSWSEKDPRGAAMYNSAAFLSVLMSFSAESLILRHVTAPG